MAIDPVRVSANRATIAKVMTKMIIQAPLVSHVQWHREAQMIGLKIQLVSWVLGIFL